jgi:BASS family bile acid:Na+ symporter
MEFLEAFYTRFVPFFLFAVMMAMGLSLTVDNFKIVLRRPKAILSGLAAQLLLLPALAIGFGILFKSPPVIAAGAIILAACPGGITSNAYVFASRADVALSVGLTAVASFITVISIPFLTLFALEMHLGQSAVPALPLGTMMWTLAQFTIIPVTLGMLLRHWRPELAKRAIQLCQQVVSFFDIFNGQSAPQ